MTIRHKANISQKINDFQVVLSKYSSQQTNKNVVQLPRNTKFDNPPPQNLSARILDQKEVSIKSIDQRINNIMKKHQNGIQYTRTPLGPLNNQSNHKKEISIHQIEIQPKSPMLSAKKQGGIKAEHSKQEWRRLRQRSNRIFESTDPYQSNKTKQNSKYDSEIEKLNQRIKQAEQKKRNLNIQFNPFVATSKSRPRLQNLSQRKLSQRPRQKNSINITSAKQELKIQQVVSKQIVSEFKIQVLTPKKLTAEKIGGIVKNKVITTPFTSILKNDLIKSIPVPVKLNQKKYIKQLIDALTTQMSLDQELRNHKIWFTFSNQDNKWIKLEQKLSSKGYMMSSQACRSKFQSTVQEHNPFYRWENIDFQQGLNALVNSYEKCESNWHVSILKRWKKQHLLEEQLKSFIIFEERKEQISIEDLVRFINTQTGKFYRNRDFIILFKRLANKSNLYIEFQTFISTITK